MVFDSLWGHYAQRYAQCQAGIFKVMPSGCFPAVQWQHFSGVQRSAVHIATMPMTVNEAGKLGGLARASTETSKERSERMSGVAKARWRDIPKRKRKVLMTPAWTARKNGVKKNAK